MSLIANFETPYVAAAADERISQLANANARWSTRYHFDAFSRQVNEVDFGADIYPLWKTTVGRLLPVPFSRGYRFYLEGLWNIVGEGPTPKAALDSFREGFHVRFQELVAMRPFEMSERDEQDWMQLRQIVNVEMYRHQLPLVLRQFGVVASIRNGITVRWEGGRQETLPLDLFPGEFASYKTGQPFEAFLERDQSSMHINKVFHVRRRSQPKHYSACDNEQFSQSLQSNKDLPVTTLD